MNDNSISNSAEHPTATGTAKFKLHQDYTVRNGFFIEMPCCGAVIRGCRWHDGGEAPGADLPWLELPMMFLDRQRVEDFGREVMTTIDQEVAAKRLYFRRSDGTLIGGREGGAK
jgi:hypothetical protein